MPAIAGTSLSRSLWLPLRIAPPAARNSSGNAKLKNAALGLRQNIFRSSRYWRQPSTRVWLPAHPLCIGGPPQVDVLQRGPPGGQIRQPPPLGERSLRQLVEQRRRVVGLELDQLPLVVAPVGDVVALA